MSDKSGHLSDKTFLTYHNTDDICARDLSRFVHSHENPAEVPLRMPWGIGGVTRFMVGFEQSGHNRGLLVSDKFGPFLVYEKERREPRVAEVGTHERGAGRVVDEAGPAARRHEALDGLQAAQVLGQRRLEGRPVQRDDHGSGTRGRTKPAGRCRGALLPRHRAGGRGGPALPRQR